MLSALRAKVEQGPPKSREPLSSSEALAVLQGC